MSTDVEIRTADYTAAIESLKADLHGILEKVEKISLADLIREGASVTTQAHDWGKGETACALSAAWLAARARGLL